MNTDVMKEWTERCFRARQGGFFLPKSLLIFDAMAAHKELSVHKQINKTGAHIAVIPGGLTCKLQPLDIAVNHPFKCFVRNEWEKWMSEGEHTFTPSGKQRRATYIEVCKWVLAAWQQISTETIRNGFKKAGLLTVSEANSEPAVEGRFISADDDSDEESIYDLADVANMLRLFEEDSEYDTSFDGFTNYIEDSDISETGD